MKKAVIFDIDGVLAEKSPDRGYRDYDKVDLDKPIQQGFELLQYYTNQQYKIIFTTGRKEFSRKLTEDWILKYHYDNDIVGIDYKKHIKNNNFFFMDLYQKIGQSFWFSKYNRQILYSVKNKTKDMQLQEFYIIHLLAVGDFVYLFCMLALAGVVFFNSYYLLFLSITILAVSLIKAPFYDVGLRSKMKKIGYNSLYMRDNTDHRKAEVVKKEIYDKHIKGKYDVVLAIDDDPDVCRMWKNEGLFVLQVGTRDDF